MIRVVKQLCINSPSILEGELWEKTIFATASYIASFLVPPRRRQAFHLPRSTSPAPQASVPRSTSPALQASVPRSTFHVPRAAGKLPRSSFHVPRAAGKRSTFHVPHPPRRRRYLSLTCHMPCGIRWE